MNKLYKIIITALLMFAIEEYGFSIGFDYSKATTEVKSPETKQNNLTAVNSTKPNTEYLSKMLSSLTFSKTKKSQVSPRDQQVNQEFNNLKIPTDAEVTEDFAVLKKLELSNSNPTPAPAKSSWSFFKPKQSLAKQLDAIEIDSQADTASVNSDTSYQADTASVNSDTSYQNEINFDQAPQVQPQTLNIAPQEIVADGAPAATATAVAANPKVSSPAERKLTQKEQDIEDYRNAQKAKNENNAQQTPRKSIQKPLSPALTPQEKAQQMRQQTKDIVAQNTAKRDAIKQAQISAHNKLNALDNAIIAQEQIKELNATRPARAAETKAAADAQKKPSILNKLFTSSNNKQTQNFATA